jgi:hypothetical protein
LFSLKVIKKGNAEMVDATTAPNPNIINKVGKAQQRRVDRELKSEKKLDILYFKLLIFLP